MLRRLAIHLRPIGQTRSDTRHAGCAVTSLIAPANLLPTSTAFSRRFSTESGDYYRKSKKRELTPQEIKDICFKNAIYDFDPNMFKDDPETEQKFKEAAKSYKCLTAREDFVIYVDCFLDEAEAQAQAEAVKNVENDVAHLLRHGGGRDEDDEVVDGLSIMEAIRKLENENALRNELAGGTCGGTGLPPGTRPGMN